MFLDRLLEPVNLFRAKVAWRRKFPGNSRLGSSPVGTENISIGRGTYGHINILTSDANPRLSVGSYCSIAREVTFVIGDEHPLDLFSTFPFKVMSLWQPVKEAFGKGGVTVCDDVWLGYRATVLDGVTIGRGGGRCLRGSRHEGRAALHHRGGRPCEADTQALRRRDDRCAVRAGLRKYRRGLGQGPSGQVVPPHGCAARKGAVS